MAGELSASLIFILSTRTSQFLTIITCLYNFDPLKPHFYIVKLGFKGYTLFLLYLLKT